MPNKETSTWEIYVKDPNSGEQILHLIGKDKEEMVNQINEKMKDLRCDERIRIADFGILNAPSQRAQRPKWTSKMDSWITISKICKYKEPSANSKSV